MAWALVTFVVVPVLVIEGVGPIEAIKRSAREGRPDEPEEDQPGDQDHPARPSPAHPATASGAATPQAC